MKKIAIFVLAAFMYHGCGQKTSSDKMEIAVTIRPQKYFVEKIAGDLVTVNVLVPPGASAELYSLMPSQMRGLSKATAWFRIGKIGFEEGWHDKIRQSVPNLKIFDTSAQAKWIAGMEETHGDHVHLHGIDPHIWMATDEVEKIAEETFKALKVLIPEKQEILEKNYMNFKREIEQLDKDLRDIFVGVANRKFLIYHPALGYLARQYGLEQIALEVDGKEPSLKYMRELVDQAKKDNIKVIFIQKEFNTENAQQLANEINGKVVQIDPLNENWDQELREIAKKIAEASAGRPYKKKQPRDFPSGPYMEIPGLR